MTAGPRPRYLVRIEVPRRAAWGLSPPGPAGSRRSRALRQLPWGRPGLA